MNPFDLRGPPFLVFYLMISTFGLLWLFLSTRGIGSTSPRIPSGDGRRQLRDPYLLAYLRGGLVQLIQTVAFSLHERKLVSFAGEYLCAMGGREALQAVSHPVERALLTKCPSNTRISKLLQDPLIVSVVESYTEPLRQSGLLVDADERRRRLGPTLLVVGVLVGVSLVKLYLAFQRGHSNVFFLIFLTAIACFLAAMIYAQRRTAAGNRALRDQQTLFARLKGRVGRLAANGATNEAVLVAAAFGFEALPDDSYPFAAQLRRQVQDNSSNNTWSSCGGGGGSSCGGGGGGCGGCGGS